MIRTMNTGVRINKLGLVLCTCVLAGCAFFRWKPAQRLYTDVHLLRLNIERLPGVVTGVNLLFPLAPEIRLGLDSMYKLDQLGVEITTLHDTLKKELEPTEDESGLAVDVKSSPKPDSTPNKP